MSSKNINVYFILIILDNFSFLFWYSVIDNMMFYIKIFSFVDC